MVPPRDASGAELSAISPEVGVEIILDTSGSMLTSLRGERRIDLAKEVLADLVTERELRTWKELHRVVRVMLCTGRTHLDTCLPPDFWPRLKSRQIAGPFMDATCVLAELFWRKRYLDDADIRQRYEFARDCFARAADDCPSGRSFE